MSYLQQQIASLLRSAAVIEPIEPYYEVLQYITLDGTEYFDTGYYGNTIKTSVDFRISVDSFDSNSGVCGSRNDTTATESSMCILFLKGPVTTSTGTHQNAFRLDWVSGDGTTFTSSLTLGGETTVTCTSNKAVINGTSYTSTGTRNYDQNNPFYIGTVCSGSGTVFTPALNGKIYVFKIFESGVLVHDYIPALDSQMRPCLYDKVEKMFLYAKKVSDGTTTYDLGFKRWNKFDVDYIENTGTSYIAFSDITPSTTMGMNIEYAYTTLSSSEPAGVIGTYNGDTQRKDTFFVSTSSGYTQKASSPSSSSCGVMVFHRGGNVGTSSSSSASYIEPEKDVWYQATVNWLGDGEIYWTNGTTDLQASVGANAVMTNGLRLFSRCNSSNNTYNNCKSRVRKLQFSDGSTIIRDYVPVVWHSSNTTAIATLYDKVYNKMLTPTGSLKAYIEKSTFSQLRSYTENNTHGYYISATGVVTAQAESDYSGAIPVKQGDIITLTVTTDSTNSNKRIHGYNGTSTNDWVRQLGVIEYSQAGEDTRTLSVVVPSGISYIRISHSIYGETQCDLTITKHYEVGKSVSGTPSSSVSGVSNCFDTGLYGTQDTTVKYIGVAYDNNSTSGQLFGSYDGTQATSQNLTINSTGSSGNTAPIRFDGKVITTPIRIETDKSVSIVNSKYGLWVNDSLHGSWGDVNDFTTTTTLLILKCNNSTNTRNNGCGYCLILDKDEPVAEYIPVKNGSTIGLYDTVSKTVNTGVGTINFNALD